MTVEGPEAGPEAGTGLSIVVPAYRAAYCIASTIEALRTDPVLKAAGRSQTTDADDCNALEVVVVDDGSDDSTAEVARKAGADMVLVLSGNHGKGAAVRAGVMAASGRAVVFTDADLAYPPSQIASLLAELESGADVVIGNRHDPTTVQLSRSTSARSAGSWAINRLASRLLMLKGCHDTQCGLKAFHGDVARMLFPISVVNGFAFDIEILHLANIYGLRIVEVPVEVANPSVSTVRMLRDGISVLRDIRRIRMLTKMNSYPSVSSVIKSRREQM